MSSDFVTCLGRIQEDVLGVTSGQTGARAAVNNQCPFEEYRPVGYGQQDCNWTLSSAVRASTSSLWGKVHREESQCQGPNLFLWPLSLGAVVKPQGRQLYQHDLVLHAFSFTQTPLNSHQSRLCTSSKHRDKQQTLDTYRLWGGGGSSAFWGWEWSSEYARKNASNVGSTELHMWQMCKYTQKHYSHWTSVTWATLVICNNCGARLLF